MIPIVEDAAATDWPGWIQAGGVVIALLVTGYQMFLDRRDRKADQEDRAADTARHERVEFDKKIRQRMERDDRRRERLIDGYAKFTDGALRFLTKHRQADLVSGIADEIAGSQPGRNRGAEKAAEGAIQLRDQSREGMFIATAAHLAIRIDEDEQGRKVIDDLYDALAKYRGGDIDSAIGRIMSAILDRTDRLRRTE